MRYYLLAAMALGFSQAPAWAAVVIDSPKDNGAAFAFAPQDSKSGPTVVPAPSVEPSNPVEFLNDTFSSYASLLPEPSDWVLLVTGFAVIGYAMRSRKRGRVSFN
ncbi:MAG: hypothetical protein ABI898_01885 [Sphingomonadales bacterium]